MHNLSTFRFDLNYKDSIQKRAIWLEIWFEFFGQFHLKRFKSRQISCLLTDAKWNTWIIKILLLRMKFNAELKLHHTNWMINMVSTMTLRYISRVITPKNTLCQKYRFIASYYFPLKIYLHIYFCERFEIWPWKIWDLKKMGIRDLAKWFKSISWTIWDPS